MVCEIETKIHGRRKALDKKRKEGDKTNSRKLRMNEEYIMSQ